MIVLNEDTIERAILRYLNRWSYIDIHCIDGKDRDFRKVVSELTSDINAVLKSDQQAQEIEERKDRA